MTRLPSVPDRLAEAGADVLRIGQTTVAIKIDDLDSLEWPRHPVWPLCRALQGVGIGRITVHGGISYSDELAEAMRRSDFAQFPAAWIDLNSAMAASAADVLVDLTNDPASKAVCLDLCRRVDGHFVSIAWDSTWIALVTTEEPDGLDRLHRSYGGHGVPLPAVVRIAAGVAMQEILRVAGQLDRVPAPEDEVVFNVAHPDRRGWDVAAAWTEPVLREARLDVVGAGAVGVHLLEALAPVLAENCELRIFDPDEVGLENLSLQIAYDEEDVGYPKAVVIGRKLADICRPGLEIRPMVMPYEDRPSTLSRPSLRIACPDTFACRLYVNRQSVRDGVPLAEAGSSPLAAQVRVYVPGHTACLEHRIPNLQKKAAAEQGRASCGRNPARTLPGTNMIIAGILAAEAMRALQPEVFGPPSQGTITYDARAPERFGVVEVRPPCRHLSDDGRSTETMDGFQGRSPHGERR